MRLHLKVLNLLIASLLLAFASDLVPSSLSLLPTSAQAQTHQDRIAEANRLLQQGIQQTQTSDYQVAIQSLQQALVIYREIKNRNGEASALKNLGNAYLSLSDNGKAIEYYQQALSIFQQLGNRNGEALALINLGLAYGSLSEYGKAIEYYQQARPIFQQLGDRHGEAKVLGNLGNAYLSLSDNGKAIKFFQQAMPIFQQVGDRHGEASTLNNLGNAYLSLSDNGKAIEYYQQALPIFQQLGNRNTQADVLANLGIAYWKLSEYGKAIEFSQQALSILQEVGDRNSEAKVLTSLGVTYGLLSEYGKAIEFFQQALLIFQEVRDRNNQANALNNLGLAYFSQSEYGKAIEYYEQALPIFQEVRDRNGEANALMNLGNAYLYLSEYDKAIEFSQQALSIFRQVRDRNNQANALTSLGVAYGFLPEYSKAIEFHQQALSIYRQVGDRAGEGANLSNIGLLLEDQKQPELAIAFYKQSVNVREGIRQDIRTLSRALQESYTQSVADTYRRLADLLLSQGRILEAQRVLELLRIQEIRDYTQDVRAVVTQDGIQYTPTEQKILDEFNSLIAFGQKIAECERAGCGQLSQLNQQRESLTAEYNQRMEAIVAQIRDRKGKDDAFFDPRSLGTSARKIVEAQPHTLLVYPLVLEDKLWLLWVAPNGVVNPIEVPVTQKQLGDTVVRFRSLLSDRTSDINQVKATGKQLYQWLIQPLEKELGANQIQNLVFSLDRVTRYIPMAALFDGQQYLVEKYQISTILSAELTNMSERLSAGTQNTAVLALGLSEAKAGFNPLQDVPQELDAIVRSSPTDPSGIYPGQIFLNQEFTFRALADHLLEHRILHIATHGAFTPGLPDASYLLLGDGNKLTIPEVKTLYNLSKVHLAVLSACETALGGPDAEGLEIAGLGFYFTEGDRAKAVMASLWLVNDSSTSELMQQFYSNLAQATSTTPMTKAEALRQAQLTMLRAGGKTGDGNRSSVNDTGIQNGSQAIISRDPSHPYYWAPFILIGNPL